MGRYSGKSCRLLCMLSLTLSFFLVEIITGYITNSLALIGDSYHMLSDVVALLVGFASVRISKWNTQKNTFGWARAEVLGALINSVFLIALCFTILIEALQRLYNTEEVQDPELMLIVGGIGLFVNLIGLALFAGHGHSHGGGGHGHSHGGGGHGHSHSKKNASHKNGGTAAKSATQQSDGSGGGGMAVTANGSVPNAAGGGAAGTESEASNPDAYTDHQHEGMDDGSDQEEAIMPTSTKIRSSAQLNMRGVFLHVLGDALGSVIVVISALMIKFIDAEWRFKVDPALSLVMVTIILSTTIPLLKESALILLQTVPTHITVSDLQDRLVQQVEGVMAVHEFHVWQLAGNRIIASAHIRCKNLRDYMLIAEQVKTFFHNEGIHSTTIQPEFAEEVDGMLCSNRCLLDHCTDTCQVLKCCNNKSKKSTSHNHHNHAPHNHCGDDHTHHHNPSRMRAMRDRVTRAFGRHRTSQRLPMLTDLSHNAAEKVSVNCTELCDKGQVDDGEVKVDVNDMQRSTQGHGHDVVMRVQQETGSMIIDMCDDVTPTHTHAHTPTLERTPLCASTPHTHSSRSSVARSLDDLAKEESDLGNSRNSINSSSIVNSSELTGLQGQTEVTQPLVVR